jgi:hypothetical protein
MRPARNIEPQLRRPNGGGWAVRSPARALAIALVLLVASLAGCGLTGGDEREPASNPDARSEQREQAPSPAPFEGEYTDVRYVSTSGSDDGPGTAERPWQTIEHALSEHRPGTRVIVRDGTYREHIDDDPSGTEERPMTLEAEPGSRPVLHVKLELDGSDHFKVKGFLFDGDGVEGVAIRVNGGSEVEFRDNEVRNYRDEAAQGFLLDYDVQDVRIVGNRIHDLGTWLEHDHGIYCKVSRGAYIANNVIYRLDHGAGIHLYSAEEPGCDESLITANTIVDNLTSGIVISREADDNEITGNVIAGHGNTDTGSYGRAIREGEGVGDGNVIRDNLSWANAAEPPFECSACSGDGNTVGDPRFVNPEDGDFRLAAGSAAVDRFQGEGVPARDFRGRTRPRGRAADLGAFER